LVLLTIASSKLVLQGTHDPTRIPDEYIVVYHENTTEEQFEAHFKRVGYSAFEIQYKYIIGKLFKGFAGKLGEQTLDELLEDPLISAVHCNAMAHIDQCVTQANAPSWGLARTSHVGSVANGLNNDFYNVNGGSGVDVYILDTGIYIQHNNFGGRARVGANFVDNNPSDQNSHGTHCAGTAAGSTFGVAKQSALIAVKVLGANGSGSFAGIIQGINYVTNQPGTRPAVASMSLGGQSDGGMCAAIASSVAAGITYSVAAGNSNANACNFYPAACAASLTVGSTDIAGSGGSDYDIRSSFSNFGNCVDIFAPGTAITSCGITGPNSSSVKSGTSMACPHVTGQIAVLLGQNPNYTPAQVTAALKAQGQSGLIDSVGAGSPNLLLYNGCG